MCNGDVAADLKPCRRCDVCLAFDPSHRYVELNGICKRLRNGKIDWINYEPIDCTAVTESELKDIRFTRRDCNGTLIVYLDEVIDWCGGNSISCY